MIVFGLAPDAEGVVTSECEIGAAIRTYGDPDGVKADRHVWRHGLIPEPRGLCDVPGPQGAIPFDAYGGERPEQLDLLPVGFGSATHHFCLGPYHHVVTKGTKRENASQPQAAVVANRSYGIPVEADRMRPLRSGERQPSSWLSESLALRGAIRGPVHNPAPSPQGAVSLGRHGA